MTRLSPFHTELIDFLQREAEKDAPLQEFEKVLRQALLPTSTDSQLLLAEILEKSQHLFEVGGSIHVERKLLEAFSKREFADLRLEKEYPKIYRGLPRLYRRDQPARSHIKKNFTHLPTLLRLAAEKAIVQLYKSWIPPKDAKIALFTWIIPDGWGDFHAAAQVVKKLRKRFPTFQIDWIVLAPEKYALPEEEAPSRVIRYKGDCPLSLLDKKTLAILSSAEFILQFPTYYPHTPELKERIGKIHSMGEYGFLESSWFHPQTGNRSMGLHFLEKGILIPEIVPRRLIDLQSKQLLQWIFGAAKPTPAKEKKYLATNHFYLAYLSTISGGMVYLHALFKSLEEDRKDIDICIPDLRWFVHPNRPILEGDFGIREINIYFGEEIHSLKIQKKGKKVRIFSPEALSRADFQVLLQNSGEFVAVRGNQSFSEAVSADKIFFYDGREHGRYFLKDLLAIAENRIGTHPSALACFRGMGKAFLYNLPVQEGEWVDEVYFQEKEPLLDIALEIGSALKSSDTLAGFKKFNAILKEEYSFEDFLYPFVLREICHMRHPEIAQYEETHLELFSTGSCTFSVLATAILENKPKDVEDRKANEEGSLSTTQENASGISRGL